MKKKLFLALVISIFCMIAFATVASAKDVDIQIKDVNGNSIVLPTVDSESDPLTWYRVTDKPTEGAYFEYVDGSTTYYIVSVKTKDAAYVNDKYRVCYSYTGLKTGPWNSNIMATNIDGLKHEDGTGPQYFDFVFEGTPICYVYIPASFLALQGTSGNSMKALFYGCSNLVGVDIEQGSLIETLYGNGFFNCKKLSYIRLPENLKTISENAFVGINPTIVVPRSVTTFEISNWSNTIVQFTGTASDHAGWTYQPTSISYVEHCEVYHNSQHIANEDDFDCTTPNTCANCDKVLQEAQANHNTKSSCVYEKGFMNVGKLIISCQNEGCAYKEESDMEELFTCLGYSSPDDGRSGLAIGFIVNSEAIQAYEEVTEKTIRYGVFAVSKDNIENKELFDANGKKANGVISTEITDYNFNSFEVRIVEFAENQKDLKLAMGAYIALEGQSGTEYAYLQNNLPNDGEKYAFTSFNEAVSNKTLEEVLQ